MGLVTGSRCADWLGTLAMDAIGRTSPEEHRALSSHLAECESCRHEAEELGIAVRALDQLDRRQLGDLGASPGLSRQDLERQLDVDGLDPPVRVEPWLPESLDESPVQTPGSIARPPRWRRIALVGSGIAAAAVIVTLAVSLPGAHLGKTVALTGQPGVTATVSLSAQSWGTQATLVESGQAGGQVLTVSMKTASGRWWAAGSYRTASGSNPVSVQFSCAVDAGKITDVWVTDQAGHTVLNGYVD
jgi:hypothetical protein